MNKKGNVAGIVSGTTQPMRDAVGLFIAQKTAEVIKAACLIKPGKAGLDFRAWYIHVRQLRRTIP